MKIKTATAALLCGSAIALASPAAAQETSAPAEDTQARIDQLQKQVEELQKSLAELQKGMTKTTPSWKGAPQLEDKDKGWSFKPRGRVQYDFATVSSPDGIDDPAWYQPVPRGLESKIAEKMAFLRRLDDEAGKD